MCSGVQAPSQKTARKIKNELGCRIPELGGNSDSSLSLVCNVRFKICATWELVRNTESQLPKETNESEFAFNKIPGVYTFHSFLICSTIDRLLGPFHVLATVNNGVINMKVQTSLTHSVFVSFECISRSGIAGSYGRSTFFFSRSLFNFFERYPYSFPSGYTNLHSHSQSISIPLSLHAEVYIYTQ